MLRSDKKRKLFFRVAVVAPFVLLILFFSGQIVYTSYFNKQVYQTSGADQTRKTYLDMEPRDDSTSSWLKSDFKWNGKTIDLNAQTIDGVLYNKSQDTINRWTIRIDIKDNCFINNAWCGTMEIHQHVASGQEKKQTIDLRKYEIDKVTLDHVYDGDLLIPLEKGDYIIYYPSEEDNEVPLAGKSELTMGVIFYYFDTLDFYDYTLEYTYHRTLTQGAVYYVMIGVGILWLIGVIVWLVSRQIYKDAERQMEQKRSALSCMSDLYQSIYMIDLEKDTLTAVTEKMYGDLKRPATLRASAQIRNLFEVDAEEDYKEAMLDLCDLSKLPERLREKQSIAGEYKSKTSGWCSIRIFAMDQIEGRDLDRVLFTIQIVDSEKREIDDMTEQISRAKKEIQISSSFLETLSDDLDTPLQGILEAEKALSKEGGDKVEQSRKRIRREAKKIGIRISDIREFARLESGKDEAKKERFSLESLLSESSQFGTDLLSDSEISFRTDFGPDLPKEIIGDRHFLARVLCNLIETAYSHTEEGSICLSVFGKTTGQKAHLVFSVRDTGDGKKNEKQSEAGILIAEGLLLQMDSELHIINTPGSGTESYFELETEAL